VRVAAVSITLAIGLLLTPMAATAAPLTVTCNGGGCDTSGWYHTNVTVAFQWDPAGVTSTSGCDTQTISSDTTGRAFDCKITYGTTPPSTVEAAFTIKRDATPPNVTGVAFARGPDANGWYNHPVGYGVSGTDATSGIASCASGSYGGPDTGGTTVGGTCTDNAGNVSASATSSSFKYDSTPPSVSVSLSRGPDSNGWYNHPVDFAAHGSDNLSGVASCNSGTVPGSAAASCTDGAGNTASVGVSVNYDSSGPSIDSVAPDRPPDSNGWYNHPVTVTYHGSDGGSGIDSCTSTAYKGPDNPNVTITGGCSDKAGNHTDGSPFQLKYDSTPPTISNVAVTSNDKFVSLTWTTSQDTTALSVTRAPGTTGNDPSTVFTGPGNRYDDRTVVNKVKYTYTITAVDQAGNKATDSVTVTPAAPLYSPAQGAVVKTPPMLGWRPISGASYYNVQLFYTGSRLAASTVPSRTLPTSAVAIGRKVLSVWPLKPHYRLAKKWKYAKKVRKLVPGHYTWLVFPGYGKRAAHKYGPLIGHSDFVYTGR
jgi:hypothetical protein